MLMFICIKIYEYNFDSFYRTVTGGKVVFSAMDEKRCFQSIRQAVKIKMLVQHW